MTYDKLLLETDVSLDNPCERESLHSIAISLKRIADVICRPPPVMVELTAEQAKEIEKDWGNLRTGFIPFNRHAARGL